MFNYQDRKEQWVKHSFFSKLYPWIQYNYSNKFSIIFKQLWNSSFDNIWSCIILFLQCSSCPQILLLRNLHGGRELKENVFTDRLFYKSIKQNKIIESKYYIMNTTNLYEGYCLNLEGVGFPVGWHHSESVHQSRYYVHFWLVGWLGFMAYQPL